MQTHPRFYFGNAYNLNPCIMVEGWEQKYGKGSVRSAMICLGHACTGEFQSRTGADSG